MKIGIGVDDWKLSKFEKELKKAGFLYSSRDLTNDGKTILITVISDNKDGVAKVCKECEEYFNNKKSKFN